MFEERLLRRIQFDEGVQLLIHPSWLFYSKQIALSIVVLLSSVFFAYGLSKITYGWLAILILLLSGISLLMRVIFLRGMTALIVTNKRIIDVDRAGIFEEYVSECTLDKIQDIRYNRKGIMQTVLNIGTVIIETAGGKGHIECQYVHEPEQTKDQLMNIAQRHNQDNHEKETS